MEASEQTPTTDLTGASVAEAVEPTPEPQAQPEPEAQETPQAPDLNEQLAALNQEMQAIRSALPAQEPEPEYDLYDRLTNSALEPEEGAQTAQGYENPAFGEPGQVDPFDALIRERVAEAVVPIQQQYEMDKRRGQLNDLAQTHPELLETEYQEAIADRLAPLVDRYGDEMLLTDPMQVEMALIAIKAERASAAEVPAEQAANQGARLETAASATTPQAQESPEDQIKRGILSAGGGRSAFT